MCAYHIKPFKYSFSDDDIDFIVSGLGNLLKNNEYLTMGDFGEQFERDFSQHAGQPYAIAVSSGTAALEIILKTIGISGGKVIVPTNTFGATVIPILRAGGTPIFADCTSDLTIDPSDVVRKLSKDVKAVITVHIGGLISPHTLELQKVCAERNIPLIEDAAHAVGSSLNGQKAGSFGIAAAFSFFATKLLTCGEGGMIVTNDESIDHHSRLLRNHAKILKNRMIEEGYNWRMTEMQSLLGIRQLAKLDNFISRRNEIAKVYDEILRSTEGAHILFPPPNVIHNRYKYILILESCKPQDIESKLLELYDIPLGGYVYEEPCHKQPAFNKFTRTDCKVAEKLCSSHICLPIYQDMTDAEAIYVATSVKNVILSLQN